MNVNELNGTTLDLSRPSLTLDLENKDTQTSMEQTKLDIHIQDAHQNAMIKRLHLLIPDSAETTSKLVPGIFCFSYSSPFMF